MSKHKDKKVKKQQGNGYPSDAELIEQCVKYIQAVTANRAGYDGDPDGNSQFAERAGERLTRKRDKALALIAAYKATSAEGISAKARIVRALLMDDDWDVDGWKINPNHNCRYGGNLQADAAAFFLSLARDVKEFTDKAAAERWAARLEKRVEEKQAAA